MQLLALYRINGYLHASQKGTAAVAAAGLYGYTAHKRPITVATDNQSDEVQSLIYHISYKQCYQHDE